MRHTSKFRAISVGMGIAIFGFAGAAAHSRPLSDNLITAVHQEPDNTAVNKQAGATADQQKGTPADRELARKIRSAITGDDTLSLDAHNVKVIVRDGVVTLRGPVLTAVEKKSIGDKAAELAGADNVHNEITVKS